MCITAAFYSEAGRRRGWKRTAGIQFPFGKASFGGIDNWQFPPLRSHACSSAFSIFEDRDSAGEGEGGERKRGKEREKAARSLRSRERDKSKHRKLPASREREPEGAPRLRAFSTLGSWKTQKLVYTSLSLPLPFPAYSFSNSQTAATFYAFCSGPIYLLLFEILS